MVRYFIFLSYNGAAYHGWQIQPNAVTVQEVLEQKITMLLRAKTEIVGAGRTDAGVHARLMVAHFDASDPIDCTVFTDKLNRMLPRDIAIYRIVPVIETAHARFDAIRRRYQYLITSEKDPFNYPYVYKYFGKMDFAAMNQACEVLYEYRDFTSFSKLHTDVKTNNCRIYHARWEQRPDGIWMFSIEADRFLRNMVRAIVGTLLEVGRGKLTIDGFRDVIERKDRGVAGTSMPAQALYLTNVEYDRSIFMESKETRI